MRQISFSLDEGSIAKAIREMEDYKRWVEAKIHELMNELTGRGVEIAIQAIAQLEAVDTGELSDSIDGYYSPTHHVGFIYTTAFYAPFVEYGTGVEGKKGQKNPFTPAGWAHDHNKHGEGGWNYISERDGKLHWTKGQVSRPFMYNTYRELERRAGKIAKEVFGP